MTIEQYVESFPNSTFPKIKGESMHNKIKLMHKLVPENAASIESTRGGSQHRLLAIALDPNPYLTLTSATFMPPTNLGTVHIITGNTYLAQVAAQENTHKEYLKEHKECVKVGKVILQQTTSVFKPKCICHLHNQCARYNNTTVLQVFQHLFSTHGNVTEIELIVNE